MTQTPKYECIAMCVCVSHGPILPQSVSQLIGVREQVQNKRRKKMENVVEGLELKMRG